MPRGTRAGNYEVTGGMGDPWEQLQDVLQWVHNRRVIREFRDLSPEDSVWQANLETPRARLRWACTLQEDDSATMTVLRLFLFYIITGQAFDGIAPVYGMPIAGFQESRKFHPQIQLNFEETDPLEAGYQPVTGRISFRLMQETTEQLTLAEVRRYAQRIATNFGAGNGFVWRKGKILASYTDREKGYKLQLLVLNESEARRVIEQVLDIQQHTPDWSRLNFSKNEREAERFPIVPEQIRVLGEVRRAPRARPRADVRFATAFLHIWGRPTAVVLYDLSGRHRRPVVLA